MEEGSLKEKSLLPPFSLERLHEVTRKQQGAFQMKSLNFGFVRCFSNWMNLLLFIINYTVFVIL